MVVVVSVGIGGAGTVNPDSLGDWHSDDVNIGLGDPDDVALVLVLVGVLGRSHRNGADASGEESADAKVHHGDGCWGFRLGSRESEW